MRLFPARRLDAARGAALRIWVIVGCVWPLAACESDGSGASLADTPGGFVDVPSQRDTGAPDAATFVDQGGAPDAGPNDPNDPNDPSDPDAGPGDPDLPGQPDAPVDPSNTAPSFATLPPVALEMGESTTLDVNPYIADLQDPDAALTLSWSALHVAIADPGSHVLTIVAPTDWVGVEEIVLTVTDSGGLTAQSALVVTVDEGDPNDPNDPKPECGETTFSYDAPGASEVLLAGEFNGWAASAGDGAYVLDDPDGDGTWEVTVVLDPGAYQYKFIVDGDWLEDPGNPNKVDDGFGGYNSLLEITCDDPGDPGELALLDYQVDAPGKSFSASFSGVAADVTVTLNHDPVMPGSVTPKAGGFDLNLSQLPDGIHDVRVSDGSETLLLKVYINESTDWRDTNIYFAMTDRFANGDPGNDAAVADVDWRTNYQGGDFKGISDRIAAGYFDELGVEAIWISWPADNPDGFHEGTRVDDGGCGLNPATANSSPMRYTGYHGYWPKDGYSVDEHFGTMSDLQALVTTAHAHGIRILLDFTANHVHEQSPLWSQHENDGWFNTPAEICEDVGWDNKPKTCWFVSYLPDLNYNNPDARKALIDQAIWWVKETGADGFRLDAVKHIEMSFIEELRWRAKQELELTGVDFYIVGETFTGDVGLINSFVGDTKIHAQFDFPSNLEILKGFARREIGLDAMDNAVRGIKGQYGAAGDLMSTFLGNHDIARFISHASYDIQCGVWDVVSNINQGWNNPPGTPGDDAPYQKLQLAFTYVMTIPGIPLIYYGDEIGLPGGGDPDNRRFMLWGPELSWHQDQTLAFMKTLGKVVQSHAALRKGSWSQPLWTEGDFLAYARQLDGETAIVLLNIGDFTKSGSLTVSPVGLGDGTVLTDVLGEGGQRTVSGGQVPFEVPARSAWILVTE